MDADGDAIDPIPGLSSGSSTPNISAVGISYGRSQSTGTGRLQFDFDEVHWNDSSFGYDVVSSSRARYITISEEGFYEAHFTCFWNSDFASGFPYIEPACYVGGFPDLLVNTAALSWNDTNGVIYGEQFTTAEMDHHCLVARVLFNFTASDFGDASPGVGVNLNAPGSVTKTFGAQIAITRLGAALDKQTIV
jgi:hypothetical protein